MIKFKWSYIGEGQWRVTNLDNNRTVETKPTVSDWMDLDKLLYLLNAEPI